MTSREILILELTEQGFSDSYIGKKIGVSGSAIAQQRRKLGVIKDLDFQSKCQFKSFNYYSIFDSPIIYPLMGTLLGDGWLTKSSEFSYTGGIAHSIKQLDYLKYKVEILKPIITNNGVSKKKTKYQVLNGKEIFPSEVFIAKFKASPDLYRLHSILYKNGKKVITDEFLKYFNEMSLALFYFDDGYKQHKNGQTRAYQIVNYDLDYNSRVKFKEHLEKMNLNCTIQTNAFNFGKNSREKFREIIEKYAVDCVKYKI